MQYLLFNPISGHGNCRKIASEFPPYIAIGYRLTTNQPDDHKNTVPDQPCPGSLGSRQRSFFSA